MEITIETTYMPLVYMNDDLPVGVKLDKVPVYERRDMDFTPLAVGVLTFASSVSASIIGAWLYDKIKGVKDKPQFLIKINNREIRRIEQNAITEIIEQEM